MMRAVLKTGSRIRSFFSEALIWRPRHREYVVVAWGLVAGALWIAVGLDETDIQSIAANVCLLVLLAAVCAIDARFGIIPDRLNLAIAAAGLVRILLADYFMIAGFVLEAAVVTIAAYLFQQAYRYVRGFDGLGLGDVKLLGASALWIGGGGIPPVLLIAVASALASLAILKLDGHELYGRRAISFGPHLALGVWWVWALGLF